MENYDEYVYCPLEDARLIRIALLLPGQKSDPLHVKLRECNLDDESTIYEAFSYCWGQETREIAISCHEGVVRITENLKSALLRFRHETLARSLWIDSICINQNNLDERRDQVKLMGEIFKKASRVLIWLGEENSETEVAYTCMEILMRSTFELPEQRREVVASLPSKIEVCRYLEIPMPDSPELYAVERLLQRPWFHRAWIYQESILARSSVVVTGSFQIPGIWISVIGMNILDIDNLRPDENEYFVGQGLAHAFSMFLQWNKMQEHNPAANYWHKLHKFLLMRRGANAYDPRDLIYSLIGAAADNDIQYLNPDYSKPWEDVYISTTREIITGMQSLDLLGEVTFDASKILPMWVPDWRKRLGEFSRFNSGEAAQSKKKYFSTGSSIPHIVQHGNPAELVLQGLCHDNVKVLPQSGNGFPEIQEFTAGTKTYKPTEEPTVLAFLRMMCVDSSIWDWENEEQITSDKDEYPPSAKQYLDWLERGVQSRNIMRTIEIQKQGRKLFLSSNGYFGYAPSCVDVGDKIYLLLGAEVPILLRKDADEFFVVGECYVHGLMNGEGLVAARLRDDPEHDPKDTSWLKTLHEGTIPFTTEEVILK